MNAFDNKFMILTKPKKYSKHKNSLQNIDDDSLRNIAGFLDNRTIINLLVVSRRVHDAFLDKKDSYNEYNCRAQKPFFSYRYKNLFTSISVYSSDDLIKCIRRYIDHKQSIQKTTLYLTKDQNLLWPFTSKEMVYR